MQGGFVDLTATGLSCVNWCVTVTYLCVALVI